ncbi:ribosomal protein L15 [Teratosphaeria nubilosa]|uniref:Ribosomal protein L15 n=1 Tax=Teratosphaeria nubilosa TaxID=161662 RepID=A0A6G1LJ61_9PEZI|nr:ribosomal protein L15 [Teratosphaeria nubilosa]
MPPRLQLFSRASRSITQAAATYQPLAPFLYPSLPSHPQHRFASILSQLSDNKGAYSKRIRVGRGPSSGYGKTSGRGHKGQKQHGKVPVGMQGGQTPDWKVHGKRGQDLPSVFLKEYSKVNLDKIQAWIDKGRLDAGKVITLRELGRSRCVHGVGADGVKLLARGKEELRTPIHIVVSRASEEAIKAVEAVGGTVTTRYYTEFAVKKIMENEMDPIHSLQRQYKYRLPDPTSRKDIEYYRDDAKRGYLSHTVAKGHGPSLFFRTPNTAKRVSRKSGGGGSSGGVGENRVW